MFTLPIPCYRASAQRLLTHKGTACDFFAGKAVNVEFGESVNVSRVDLGA